MSVKYEFKTVSYHEREMHGQWVGQKPHFDTPKEILTKAAEEGWEFCGYIPGQNYHLPAEHTQNPQFMFKRKVEFL